MKFVLQGTRYRIRAPEHTKSFHTCTGTKNFWTLGGLGLSGLTLKWMPHDRHPPPPTHPTHSHYCDVILCFRVLIERVSKWRWVAGLGVVSTLLFIVALVRLRCYRAIPAQRYDYQ